jgi:YVTN family beta-propeller protein
MNSRQESLSRKKFLNPICFATTIMMLLLVTLSHHQLTDQIVDGQPVASSGPEVIDGRLVGGSIGDNIPIGGSPTGIAVNSDTNTIYVTDRESASISVIDAETNNIVKEIPIGGSPTGIAVNSDTNTIYVINGDSSSISVIDGSTLLED